MSAILLGSCKQESSCEPESSIDSQLEEDITSFLKERIETCCAMSGQAVVMETRTGQIKAMVGLERTDTLGGYQSIDRFTRLQPSSLYKTISVLSLMDAGMVHLNDIVDTGDGVFITERKDTIFDMTWRRGGYGKISVLQGLLRCSEIAVRKEFGYQKHSLMELLSYYNAIANNGTLVQPQYTKSDPIVLDSLIADRQNLDDIRKVLRLFVTEGLGHQSAPESTDVNVSGMGGAVALADSIYKMDFCGYVPSINPQYTILVSINKKGFPISSATPGKVFKQIVETLYKK